MKTIKVFIASSEELHLERLEITDMIQQLNKALKPRGIEIEPVKWEYLDASMSAERKQSEYNAALLECEMCLVLYWNRFGEYTEEELNTAYDGLRQGKNPQKLYIYFKEPAADISEELKEFKSQFADKYGHFYCKFENIDTMRLNFLLQLEQYTNTLSQEAAPLVEIKDGKAYIGGTYYADFTVIPFVKNNPEYLLLLQSIALCEQTIATVGRNSAAYPPLAAQLNTLKEKRDKMEYALWGTALEVTRLSNLFYSKRLARAIELFNNGDNNGAKQVLSDVEHDMQQNLQLVKLGKQAEQNLRINIAEMRIKMHIIRSEMKDGWADNATFMGWDICEAVKTISGEESKEYEQALNDFVVMEADCRGYIAAIDNARKHLKLCEKLYGKDSKETWFSAARLSQYCRYDYDERDNASIYISNALESAQKILPSNSLELAYLYCVFCDLMGGNDAVEYGKLALSIYDEQGCEKTQEKVDALFSLGTNYHYRDEYENAEKYLTAALNLSIQLKGKDSDSIKEIYAALSSLYISKKDYEQALYYAKKSLEVCVKLYGEVNAHSVHCFLRIAIIYRLMKVDAKGLPYAVKALKAAECSATGDELYHQIYAEFAYAMADIRDYGMAYEFMARAYWLAEHLDDYSQFKYREARDKFMWEAQERNQSIEYFDSENWTTPLYISIPDKYQDTIEAVQKYQAEAEQGNAEAQYNLAIRYACGLGVEQDDKKTAEWYREPQ